MRLTNQRYSRDLRRYHLALRLLRFEARTGTICRLTGLAEARVRALGKSDYALLGGKLPVRHRGPAPYRIDTILEDPRRCSEAGVIVAIATVLAPLVSEEDRQQGLAALGLGEALCRLYETYREVVDVPTLSFEHVTLIQRSLSKKSNLKVSGCATCNALMVEDALSVGGLNCPVCLKFSESAFRPSPDAPLLRVAEVTSPGYQLRLL